MVTATLFYRSGNTKFYIAEPKTPLEKKNYSTRATQLKIYFFPDSTNKKNQDS